MSSHLVHEPTDDAFDLDAGPVTLEAATEPKERPGWLDADSVSPALGRDKALVALDVLCSRAFFDGVYAVEGGVDAWVAAGLPVEDA